MRRHAPSPRPSDGAARPAQPRQARRPLPLPSWGSERCSSLSGTDAALLGKPGLRRHAARPAGHEPGPEPSPALSPALPAPNPAAPRARRERARILSAAAYKALGRTTPRRGRTVPLLHRRGCAAAPISSRVGREGTGRAAPRASLKHQKSQKNSKKNPKKPQV